MFPSSTITLPQPAFPHRWSIKTKEYMTYQYVKIMVASTDVCMYEHLSQRGSYLYYLKA